MKKLFTVCVALVVAMTMTAENMTCSDAATAALALGGGVTATDSVTVTGYVSVLKGDVSTKYETPQQQFCMDDTKGSNAETLLIYWANIPEEFRESLTSLNVGDKVSVTGLLCHYVKSGVSIPELVNGNVKMLERNEVEIDTLDMTTCEVIAAAEALNADEYLDEVIIVSGLVSAVSSTSERQQTFEMTCDDNNKIFQAYNVAVTEPVFVGDSVIVVGKVKNYNGIIEAHGGKAYITKKGEVKHGPIVVTSNSSSGISNACFTATLEDGTILGFYSYFPDLGYDDDFVFCGAISQRTELTIPDSVIFNSISYPVTKIGCYNNGNRAYQCDLSNATSVKSVILPSTIAYIYDLPSTVEDLHINSDVSWYNGTKTLQNLSKLYVPADLYNPIMGNANMRNYVIILEEGQEPIRITINMTTAGEFAQLLLQQTDNNWYHVHELTVTGPLNANDLNVFKRMKQLQKLDLSNAVIADIPNNFNGATGYRGNSSDMNLLEELSLPSINNIGNYAFSGCKKLKSISLTSVNSIGQYAFSYLGAPHISLPEGTTSIGTNAFYYSNITGIDLPSTLTSIGDYAFAYSELKSIEIPSPITDVSAYCFYECDSLVSVSLPISTQQIKSYAFSNCENLTAINLQELINLKSIESYAFNGCYALKEIELAGSLRNINSGTFGGCYNIKSVKSYAVIPPSGNSTYSLLDGCDYTGVTLYVPAMSIAAYRAAAGWSDFYTVLPLEEQINNLYIYDFATIADVSEFSTDCNVTLGWEYLSRNGYSSMFYGALTYNDTATFSMHNYRQYQDLGSSSSSYPYAVNPIFTSLVANGPMRADSVQTTLITKSTYDWYFISLPYDVQVADITYSEGAQFVIRKYSGYNRAQQAGATWQNLTTDSVMHAYEGYILKCNLQDASFTFPAINNAHKNNMFQKGDAVVPLNEYLSEFEHNRSWNLIGNPYPCWYDSRYMDFSAPISVWNRYYDRYDAFSPVDDSFILQPSQAFFVQCPVDQSSITFDQEGRQDCWYTRVKSDKAPMRVAANANRKVFNIVMTRDSIEDHTRIVLNDDALLAYELDKDASKLMADNNAAMLLYSVHDGVRYAINERPMDNGKVSLGFFAPEEGDFELSLNTTESGNVILMDSLTNTMTTLTGSYRFHSVAGYHNTRLTLVFETPTELNRAVIGSDGSLLHQSAQIYSVDGRWIGNYYDGCINNLNAGIYLIIGQDVKRKIIVK
ncbi:MAG: leucine-rich repeat domain-containing protein [Paludibacteraceae bacterium]|nr:leucine-rich repeat domain-containing protein [Paludibacteraceae bacterium]